MSVTINLSEANSVSLTNAQPSAVTVAGTVGDITGVTITAGDGLTGGGTDTSGNVSLSLAVGAGTGIQVNADSVELNHLGIEDLTAPASDKILFYDVSNNATKFLTIGDNLTITDDTISAAAVSGNQPAIIDSSGTPTLATGITGDEVRTLIGAGTSSFDGAYSSLTGTPTIPSAANDATITIEAGDGLGTGGAFTTDQSTNETITLANTDKGSSQNIFKNVASDSGTAVAGTNDDTITISGGTGISTSVNNDTLTIVNDSPDQTVSLTEGSNVTITGTYPNFTIAATDTDTNTQLSDEEVQDIVGGMVSGNTETNITVTYDDTNGKLNFSATDTDTVTSVGVSGSEASGTITLSGSGSTTVSQVGNTITISSTDTDTNTQLTDEQVQDIVGAMFSGNTETLVSVTYQDADGTIDIVVDNDLSNYDNTNSGFLTAHPSISAAASVDNSGRTYIQDITLDSNGHVTGITSATETVTDTNTQLSDEEVQDIVGAMVSGNTETNISVTYDDTNGKLNFSATDTDTVTSVGVSGSEASGTITLAGSGATSVSQVGNTITISSTDTDTNTQLSDEEVQDVVGAMFSGNTETLITATYQDADGTIDLVVDNDLSNYDNTTSGFLTAHPSISAAASVDNSGRTYIQDITLDSNGHVTGITSATETVTDTDTVTSVGVSGSEATGTITLAGSGAASVSQVGNTVTISATDTDTTYTGGGDYGITLSGTEIRLEDDRRRNSTSVDIYTGNTHDYTFYDASIGIRWYTSGSEEMRLENDGDLHVDGDVIAYSTTVSDERLKDDVETITDACDKVCSLRGVEYTWNKGSRKGHREIGVIAQEVEKVVPEIVHEKKLALVDGEVYKTVDYEKLVALLIEANKELCNRVETLEKKIDGFTK